jgi:hypothetical protein
MPLVGAVEPGEGVRPGPADGVEHAEGLLVADRRDDVAAEELVAREFIEVEVVVTIAVVVEVGVIGRDAHHEVGGADVRGWRR